MNITVPQRDCSTAAAPAQVRECRVVEEVVTKPVCVTIMDKEVIEVTASLIGMPHLKCFIQHRI